MIEDIGKVVKIDGDQPYVEVERSSACASCGLQEAEDLATGGKVVIGFASILALHPKFAILAEPDSGIDMLSTQDIINVINVFKESGSSVLLITHREEISLISDKASQMCRGKIVCSGNPEKVAEYYKSRKCLVCDGEVCVYV